MVGFNKHHLAQGIREGRGPEAKRNMVRGTGRPPPPRDRKVPEKAVISKRLDEQEQQKNKEAMLAKEDDLVFMSPLIDGYALKNKLWRKLASSALSSCTVGAYAGFQSPSTLKISSRWSGTIKLSTIWSTTKSRRIWC